MSETRSIHLFQQRNHPEIIPQPAIPVQSGEIAMPSATSSAPVEPASSQPANPATNHFTRRFTERQ